MRILLCSLFRPSADDGVSASTAQLVAALRLKGLFVDVATTDWGWGKNELSSVLDGVKVFPATWNNNFEFSPALLRHLRNACAGYDLIHFNSVYSFATVLGSAIARDLGKPYIVSPRGNYIPGPRASKAGVKSVLRKQLFFSLLARRSLTKADLILCTSSLEAERIAVYVPGGKIAHIPNGMHCCAPDIMDADRIILDRLRITGESQIYLFLGRLAEEKGLPFLLDVWESISGGLPDAVLVIGGVGEHGIAKILEKKISRLKEPHSVIMPGKIEGNLKAALLKRSRCLLLPSFYESFGNVVLEALSSGTPVIASTGTPWRALDDNRLGRCLPRDLNAWASAMVSMSGDSLYKTPEFVERSCKWVASNFSWPIIAEKYVQMYQRVVNDHSY